MTRKVWANSLFVQITEHFDLCLIVSVLVYFLSVSSHAYSYSVYSQLLNDQH